MSKKFGSNLDLVQNELQNARLQNLAAAPGSPVSGQIYYDTALISGQIYNGSAWVSTAVSFGSVTAQTSYGSASANGSATTAARSDHTHGTVALSVNAASALTIAGASSAGSGTAPSKDDHTHAGPGFAAPTATTTYGLSAVTGVATTVPRSDHTHGTPSLTAVAPQSVAVAGTNTVGSGTAAAKEDHVHAGPGFAAVTASTTFGASAVTGTAVTVPHSDHTHGTPTHVGSDHSAISISSLSAPTGNVAFGSFKITGLADPTLAQDAATKNYVDSVAAGLYFHDAVESATTANLAYTYAAGSAGADGGTGVGATLTNGSVGVITIDGHATVLGDRILFKNQTTALQNGIYTVTTAGTAGVAGVFTRSPDFDNHIADQVGAGSFTFVAVGTTNGATSWIQSATGTATTPINGIKLGTDSLTFTQFAAGTTYTASNGVLLTSNNFTFAPLTNGGLQTAAGGASILLPTNSGLGLSGTGLAVGAGTGILVSTGTVAIDTSVVARKYSTTLATSSTSYTVTHNLGTLDVLVAVYLISDGSEIIVDNLRATTNTVTINFSVAPTASAYRVVVIG